MTVPSGSGIAAASSRVTVIFVTSVPPPASDQIMAFCPAGPTSRKSRSSGNVWVSPLMVTVTLTTVPRPATTIFDGYGLAVPLSGMVIVVELVKLTGVQAGVGVGVGVEVGVAVGVVVGVAVGVGDGVPQGPNSCTSSTNISVGSPALSPCARNLMRTVCPANGAMLNVTLIHAWLFWHTCMMVARMVPDVLVT